jgi:4a-hydroxytetrahydrobiopterin dehydratase
MTKLSERKCARCKPGTPPLSEAQQAELGREIPGWTNEAGKKIRREFTFPTYATGVSWVSKIAALADAEAHHPDIHIYYRKVVVESWTHTVNGLSENDYILAAKLDAAYGGVT